MPVALFGEEIQEEIPPLSGVSFACCLCRIATDGFGLNLDGNHELEIWKPGQE